MAKVTLTELSIVGVECGQKRWQFQHLAKWSPKGKTITCLPVGSFGDPFSRDVVFYAFGGWFRIGLRVLVKHGFEVHCWRSCGSGTTCPPGTLRGPACYCRSSVLRQQELRPLEKGPRNSDLWLCDLRIPDLRNVFCEFRFSQSRFSPPRS